MKKAKGFDDLLDKGLKKEDLEELDFWQMFMILSHREEFADLMNRKISKKLLLKFDSYNLEKVLENPELFLSAVKNDPEVFFESATLKHAKMDLLLKRRKEYLKLTEIGMGLKDLCPLSDNQFEEVLARHDLYHSLIKLAQELNISKTSVLEIDKDIAAIFIKYPEKLKMLIESGLSLNDLTRYPQILPEVLSHAKSILALEDRGVGPKDLFKLSKDQVVHAFSRFPLLEILPELGLKVGDLEPFLLEEFKVVLSNLKPLSLLKQGGVKSRDLAEIHLPHLKTILDNPEYTLSLIHKGVPLYRFAHIQDHQLKVLLADPLSDEAQELIARLLS